MIKNMIKDKNFFSILFSVGIPIVIQNLISSSLNLLDIIMIGQLGELSIGAVGLGNQLFFIFILLLFGTNSGGSIFISQFWGKKDLKSIHKTVGVSLTISLIASIIFSILSIIFPKNILGLFSKDIELITLGTSYMKIIGWSYILTACTFTFALASRAVEDSMLPMIASIISLITNTILNFILIFGMFGFPTLGVKGAAIATTVSRIVEFSIVFGKILFTNHPLKSKLKDYFSYSKSFANKILKKSFPVILNELFWSIGVSLYIAAYARAGTEAYASVQIAQTIDKVFSVLSFGIGSAASVMIGNLLGKNQINKAILYSRYLNILTVFIGIILAILIVITAPILANFYNVSDTVRTNAIYIMYVIAIYMVLRMSNTLQIIGTLRGGGDTTFTLIMELTSVYLVGVPMAFLSTTVWHLPIYICVALVSLEELTKAIIGFIRLLSNKWANNIVDDMV